MKPQCGDNRQNVWSLATSPCYNSDSVVGGTLSKTSVVTTDRKQMLHQRQIIAF